MRLLIVVTVPAYELVDLKSDVWRSEQIGTVTVRSRLLGDDQIVAIFQAETAKSESDIRNQTTDSVTEVAMATAYAQAQVYVAGHMGFVDLDRIREKVGRRVAACVFFSHYPKVPGLDLISDALYHMVSELTPEAYQIALDSIRAHDTASRAQRFATISHQLIRLFLPIAFDLNSWRAIDYDQNVLDRIINTYKNGECRLTLARAHLYNGIGSNPDTLEKIIEESALSRDEDWEFAKSLLPRNPPAVESPRDQVELYSTVFQEFDVLGSLTDRERMMKVKLMLEEDDVFGRWASHLETVITNLKSKIDGGLSPMSAEPLSSGDVGRPVVER